MQDKEKKRVRSLIAREWLNDKPEDGALELTIFFDMPYPASWSKKRKANYTKEHHLVKPDIDNLVKFYLDCMNGVVFHDDKQIVRVFASKAYCDHEGSTFIQVEKKHV